MATAAEHPGPVRAALLTALFGLFFFVGACGSSPATLQTQSMSQAPSIDGALADWNGRLTRLGDRSISMSAHPTDSLLYVALLVQDPGLIRSVARNGLIVWVDPSGKRKHTYGLQYPFGLRAQRRARQVSGGASGGQGRSSSLSQVLQSDFAVLRDDTVRHRAPAQFASSGLRIKARLSPGSLIYEAAIPVNEPAADRDRLGLRTSLDAGLAIGLETPKPEEGLSDDQQDEPTLVGPTGRGRTPGRRRRGRRRGRRPPPRAQSPDLPTLNLWVRVVSGEQGGG